MSVSEIFSLAFIGIDTCAWEKLLLYEISDFAVFRIEISQVQGQLSEDRVWANVALYKKSRS